MLEWLTERRRQRLLEEPFPAEWLGHIESNVRHFRALGDEERRHLLDLVQIFVHEKHWEGCGGLELDDEVRVTIAALACYLVLGLPHELYRNVQSILVYPTTVVTPERPTSTFAPPQLQHSNVPILGEAQLRGPVILVWDAVVRNARHPEHGHNVVYHEFAHKLDMLDGQMDGTPELPGREDYRRWVEVFEREYLELQEAAKKGRRTFIDVYGATNEAEFFAVATEYFFDDPKSMTKHHPDLYEVLRSFYRQDPATR